MSAGHVYGNPNNPHYGLHYPFVDYIPTLNNNSTIELGILTGDVVVASNAQYWDSAQIDINKLNFPIYIAAGNHDMGPEFINRFSDYYYSFTLHNDLFIVLTPGLDSWNISGDQLNFLTTTLNNNSASVNHIFIFLHELIWWSPTNEYQDVIINYIPHYPGSTNFDTVVKPLLMSYPNDITIFAGDLGATNVVSPFMYDHFNNITLIGSGMGGGSQDNIVITEVYADSIYYNLVALNGNNPNALGELTDFSTTTVFEKQKSSDIVSFPNPAYGQINIKTKNKENLNVKILNAFGETIFSSFSAEKENINIDLTNFSSGVYFIQIQSKNNFVTQKFIIQN